MEKMTIEILEPSAKQILLDLEAKRKLVLKKN